MKQLLKSINIFSACLCLVVLFQACNKFDEDLGLDGSDATPRIGLSEADVLIDVDGAEQVVSVAFLGRQISSWDISTSEDWLTVTKTTTEREGKSEEALAISATPNTFYARKGTITLTAETGSGKIEKTITVEQVSALPDPSISASMTALEVSAEQQDVQIDITTNQEEWTATTPIDWMTVTQTADQLTLTVQANTGDDLRRDTLYLVAGVAPYTVEVKIPVTQARPDNANEITVGGIELILVEGGTFQMGANNGDVGYVGTLATTNAPKHPVTLSDYFIGKFEITQKQYYDMMGTNPSRYPWTNYEGEDNDKYDPARPETAKYAQYPIEMITWDMAVAFCEKLNSLYGHQGSFSIPTEAQWEYAARGGKHIDEANRLLYAGSNNAGAVGNTGNGSGTDKISRSKPVGQYQPNELGIYDMTGNVFEHVYDFVAAYPDGAVTDPTGPASRNTVAGTTGANLNHGFRGGSYWHVPSTVYARFGNANADYTGNGLMGIRVVFTPKQ